MKLFHSHPGFGQFRWVVLLLTVAVVLPTAGLLWFMSHVVRNERLVVRQKLTLFYKGRLAEAVERANAKWTDSCRHLQIRPSVHPYRQLVAAVSQEGYAALLVYDAAGQRLYPAISTDAEDLARPSEAFADAWEMESITQQYEQAVQRYEEYARISDSYGRLAAYIGKSRSLAKLGRLDEAITECRLRVAFSPLAETGDARCLALIANARLLLLSWMQGNPAYLSLYEETYRRLVAMLYSANSAGFALPADQNLFIARKVLELGQQNGLLDKNADPFRSATLQKLIEAEEQSIRLAEWLRTADAFRNWEPDKLQEFGPGGDRGDRDRRWKMEDRNPKGEGKGQRTEDGEQRTENGASSAVLRPASSEPPPPPSETRPPFSGPRPPPPSRRDASRGAPPAPPMPLAPLPRAAGAEGRFYGILHKTAQGTCAAFLSGAQIAATLVDALGDLADSNIDYRILDGTGRVLAGSDETEREPAVVGPIGARFPDWSIQLFFKDTDVFKRAADQQIAVYTWTGVLFIVLILASGTVATRSLGHQVKLNRLKNDFIATVTHELKTPLASMRVLVDTLLEGNYRDQNQVTEYLQLVARENERLSRLIDNFLTFSRMERNKQAFQMRSVSPISIARTAAQAVKTKFGRGHCCFELVAPDELCDIEADHDAMVTVLVNLLDNAYKYSHEDKQIKLTVAGDERSIRFSVSDNGLGIPRRALKKIFRRFYQVDRSLSRRTEGCGLGLSIAKFIVDAHGGAIAVESKPGQGSTFTVTLPTASGP
ncbi:MAG: GHKL domain-containing protein [Planctomycetes bacterium]|nr:GHKL domain-containing protein [Planctomycetota bacterium]